MPRSLIAAALVAASAFPAGAEVLLYEYSGPALTEQIAGRPYAGGLRPRPGLSATVAFTGDYFLGGVPRNTSIFFDLDDRTGGFCGAGALDSACGASSRTALPGFFDTLTTFEVGFTDDGAHWPADGTDPFSIIRLAFDTAGAISAWDIYTTNGVYYSDISSETGDVSGNTRDAFRYDSFAFLFGSDGCIGSWSGPAPRVDGCRPGAGVGDGGGGGVPGIPLPASLPLALAGLAALGLAGRRAR